MKHNSTDYRLQAKIEENLAKLHKRNICGQHVTSTAQNNQKAVKQKKWAIIKRQLQNHHQNVLPTESKRKATKSQPLNSEELISIIKRALILQHIVMQLNESVGKYRRLQLFCIFFQCALSIVFNSYNLVVFLLTAAQGGWALVPLNIMKLLFFYGFHITTSFMDTLITVVLHHSVHGNIRRTGIIMDEMNLYVSDKAVKLWLTQFSSFVYNNLRVYNIYGLFNMDGSIIRSLIAGTTTYIIILIQYSGDGEICKPPTKLNETAG